MRELYAFYTCPHNSWIKVNPNRNNYCGPKSVPSFYYIWCFTTKFVCLHARLIIVILFFIYTCFVLFLCWYQDSAGSGQAYSYPGRATQREKYLPNSKIQPCIQGETIPFLQTRKVPAHVLELDLYVSLFYEEIVAADWVNPTKTVNLKQLRPFCGNLLCLCKIAADNCIIGSCHLTCMMIFYIPVVESFPTVLHLNLLGHGMGNA